jgi:hypothetical protein
MGNLKLRKYQDLSQNTSVKAVLRIQGLNPGFEFSFIPDPQHTEFKYFFTQKIVTKLSGI